MQNNVLTFPISRREQEVPSRDAPMARANGSGPKLCGGQLTVGVQVKLTSDYEDRVSDDFEAEVQAMTGRGAHWLQRFLVGSVDALEGLATLAVVVGILGMLAAAWLSEVHHQRALLVAASAVLVACGFVAGHTFAGWRFALAQRFEVGRAQP